MQLSKSLPKKHSHRDFPTHFGIGAKGTVHKLKKLPPPKDMRAAKEYIEDVHAILDAPATDHIKALARTMTTHKSYGFPAHYGISSTGQTRGKDIGTATAALMQTITVEGVNAFGDELTHRTLRIVMEEPQVVIKKDYRGNDIGATSTSTFLIMPILKMIISPFVCIILMLVVTPAEGGMKKGGGAIVKGGTGALGKILGMIFGFIGGVFLAYVMGDILVEACTFVLTVRLTFVVINNVFEKTAMDTICTLQNFFFNTILPSVQVEITAYLQDILSDALHFSIHHTVTRALSTRLSKSLTPVSLHYYYCVYCYYYGDYCAQCYHNDEQSIIDQLTWTNFGS